MTRSLGSELPDLVVLDLNMPIMGGRETIPMMHKDPRLHSLPLVVLTTSRAEADQEFCDDHQVPLFIKPTKLEAVDQLIAHVLALCTANS